MNEEVKTIFHYNNFALNKNLNDVSHEESLKSSDNGGNCINWVLGHIIVTRDSVHEMLGIEKICDEKITNLYIQGSKPVTQDTAVDITSLLKMYNDSQQKIMKAFDEKDFKNAPDKSKEFAGFGFHEAYHVGQTGILRRVTGKDSAIK